MASPCKTLLDNCARPIGYCQYCEHSDLSSATALKLSGYKFIPHLQCQKLNQGWDLVLCTYSFIRGSGFKTTLDNTQLELQSATLKSNHTPNSTPTNSWHGMHEVIMRTWLNFFPSLIPIQKRLVYLSHEWHQCLLRGRGPDEHEALPCNVSPSAGVLNVCQVENLLLIIQDKECMCERSLFDTPPFCLLGQGFTPISTAVTTVIMRGQSQSVVSDQDGL